MSNRPRAIAEPLGVTDVFFESLPADKVRVVAAASPRPVVMVGDGVNDAPVLAAGDALQEVVDLVTILNALRALRNVRA